MKKAFIWALLLAATSPIAYAAEPVVWTISSRSDVLRGDASGVAIGNDGTISLAPRLTEAFRTEQAFAWSTAAASDGTVYVGTGGEGKVFRIDRSGRGSLVTDLTELHVTALAVGRKGEVFAGTSPDGKVYRITATGSAEIYFQPGEKYIWAIAVMDDGSLAVATGDGGRIYRVRSAGATPASSLLFDTSEAHIISLATDTVGDLYAGSDPGGLVMKFGPDGKPFGLLDSPLREIHEMSVAPDGSVYALALADAAATPRTNDAPAPPKEPDNKAVSVEKPATGTPAAKSRYDLTGARSAVYRIHKDGAVDIVWTSTSAGGFSLLATADDRVLVGTSDKGRVYSVAKDGSDSLLLQTGANQISSMTRLGDRIFGVSSNPAVVYSFGPETVAEGTYQSPVLDAKNTATWGRIWWRSSGNVTIQTRSGNTEAPDETWSPWSTAITDQRGAQVASPKARFIQWRATLRGPASAAVNEVSLAYVPRNIAPEVLSLQILPTNVGLIANPPTQIDPNIVISGLDPTLFGLPTAAVPPRRAYIRGATSLQWTAEDRNGDQLEYEVQYRQTGDANFRTLRSGLKENFLSVDGQSLADGRYIFKVIVRDSPSNPPALALAGERTTEPIDIDNTPPAIRATGPVQRTGRRVTATFEATDASSYIVRAEYSVNGGDWIAVFADDGVSDGPVERYTVAADSDGEVIITIRVFDVNGNSGSARATGTQ